MKNTWQKHKLSDVIELIGGGTPKTSVPGYWGGKIPWLSVVDFNDDNRHVHETEKTITEEGLKNSSTKILPKGALILSARGTVGALAQLSVPMAFNQSCYGIIAKKQTTNDYLYYLIKNVVGDLQKKGHGSVFNTVTRETFTTINILLPPIEEQRKIAAVLGALDDKIELNNKINNNLEQQAQALFKSWFMDFEPFGGKMPADWKVGKLGEIAEIIMGQSPNGSTYNEEKNGCIFFQGRAEFGARFPKVRLYTTEPKRMANKGDVLMSVRAPVGDFNMAMEDCCIGRGLCAIRSKQNYQSFILYTVWASQDKLNVFNGEGTVFGSVNKDSLYNMLIIIPTNKIMQQFEYICSKLDMLIWNNSLENTKLAAIRDTLLPKLMSGEIDVSNVNISELPSADKSQLIEDDSVKF